MERTVIDIIDTEKEINRRHNEKMARRKAARERMLATKTEAVSYTHLTLPTTPYV